jgi:hypothetical protein
MESFKSAANNWRAKYRQISVLVFVVGLFSLTACVSHTTYPLIKPSSPKVSFMNTTEVDMQPVFRWTPSMAVAADVRYDLIVYEAVYDSPSALGGVPVFTHGPVVYYREGLSETEHRMEQPIKLNVIWSVRTRRGTDILSDWAGYDRRVTAFIPMGGTGTNKVKNQPFLFSVWKVANKK